MGKIKTLYIVNHSHTDIGFTDYQDVIMRQHMEFIDAAIDLCESTSSYQTEAQAKWVCEVTGITETYLRSRPSKQVDRFLKLHREGRIDVAGMQYNLTPLLNVEQMIRSLYGVKRLKDEFGIDVRVAMNCDVDGASWLFADLFPKLGIEMFTMAINPIRGQTPKPRPSAFWWEGPAGGKTLVWNGYHYLFGGLAGLGDLELADDLLPKFVAKLEADSSYPFDFIYGQTTNPTRVDNGPPDHRLSDFIQAWNESGRTPRIEWITVTQFNKILRERYAHQLPTMRGDWTDWWSDGVASSAFETGLNRTTHEVLYSAEFVGAWLKALGQNDWPSERVRNIYDSATLYDEHTWGAFSSIEAPDGLFSRSQWNRKAGLAYQASANAHDVLARAARGFAEKLAIKGDEVRFDLGQLPPELAKPTPTYKELLVINTLPFDRDVIVEEPVRRGGQAPNGMLEMYLPRGLTWGIQPDAEGKRVVGRVPAFGYSFLPLDVQPNTTDLNANVNMIENAYYRIVVDPTTGGLSEWYDKELGCNFAGNYQGYQIGEYVYEQVDSPRARDALFAIDWANDDFGTPPQCTPFHREVPEQVKVHTPVVTSDSASITVSIHAPGIRQGQCTFVLPTNKRALEVHWEVDKQHVTDPEAVFFAFPFNMGEPKFTADVNGIPVCPNDEQLPGTVRDWYPIQRWVTVNDGERGVTWVPVHAPLAQLGGITTGKWAAELEPESPTIMSWSMNNHWMVNFKASQGGKIPFKFILTTYGGPTNVKYSTQFAAESVTPPIVLRDFVRVEGVSQEGRFFEVSPTNTLLITSKPSEDGSGIIIRAQNVTLEEQNCVIRFPTLIPKVAYVVNPVETVISELPRHSESIEFTVKGREVATIRVDF